MQVTSLELSSSTPGQRISRLQALSEEGLRSYALRAVSDRNEDALWELVEAYLTSRAGEERGPSAHTLRAYRRGLRELLKLWDDEDLLRPTREAGARYLMRLEEGDRDQLAENREGKRGRRVKRGPLSPATVSLRLAAARAFYDALRWSGATDVDPFRPLTKVRRGSASTYGSARRAYTEIELTELLAAAADAHERVILLLGAHAGLRVSEMLSLRWEDVDVRAGLLSVRTGAGEEVAEVVVSARLAEQLAIHRSSSEEDVARRHRPEVLELRSQYGIYKRLKRLCARAGVEFKGIHGLRNAAGLRLYRQTRDLELVQNHLRHATLDAARSYARKEAGRLRGSLDTW